LNGETVIKRFSNSDFQLPIFKDEDFLDADYARLAQIYAGFVGGLASKKFA
jgi:hypothetical protein